MRSSVPRRPAALAGLIVLMATGCAQPVAAPSPTRVATRPAPPATAQPVPTLAPPPPTVVASPTMPVASPTAAASPRPVGSGDASEVSYRRLQAEGLSFEVPSGWADGGEPGSFRDPTTGARLGVNVVPWSPGMESESALPNHSVVTGRTPLSLPWGSGGEYGVETSAPAAGGSTVTGHETHVIVRLGNKSIVDVYSAVPAGVSAEAADRARQHLLQSITLLGGWGGARLPTAGRSEPLRPGHS